MQKKCGREKWKDNWKEKAQHEQRITVVSFFFVLLSWLVDLTRWNGKEKQKKTSTIAKREREMIH